MEKDILLYFRNVADEDNDDNNGAVTSACFPASRLRGMNPTADTTLTLYFDSLKNEFGDSDTAAEVTVADNVALTIATHRHKEVMEALIRKINGMKSNPKATGFLVVADDVTTNTADEAVSAVTFDGNVSQCGTITLAAPFDGS